VRITDKRGEENRSPTEKQKLNGRTSGNPFS
jgi:hypothetical protein